MILDNTSKMQDKVLSNAENLGLYEVVAIAEELDVELTKALERIIELEKELSDRERGKG